MNINDIKKECLFLKKQQFISKDINITEKEIDLFLEKVYFKFKKINKENLIFFLKDNNLDEIISFLMSEAIINPKI